VFQSCCKNLIEVIEQNPGITYNDIVHTSKFNTRTLDAAIRELKKTNATTSECLNREISGKVTQGLKRRDTSILDYQLFHN
jgi:hypothetical protein